MTYNIMLKSTLLNLFTPEICYFFASVTYFPIPTLLSVIIIVLVILFFVQISHFCKIIQCFLSASGLFHLAQCPLGYSGWSQKARLPFSGLSKIPFYMKFFFHLPISITQVDHHLSVVKYATMNMRGQVLIGKFGTKICPRTISTSQIIRTGSFCFYSLLLSSVKINIGKVLSFLISQWQASQCIGGGMRESVPQVFIVRNSQSVPQVQKSEVLGHNRIPPRKATLVVWCPQSSQFT